VPVALAAAQSPQAFYDTRSKAIEQYWSAWRFPGELVWSIAAECEAIDNAILPDGATVVITHCLMQPEQSGHPLPRRQPAIFKLDRFGSPIWARRFDFGGFDKFDTLQSSPDGALYASGTRQLCPGSSACRQSVLLKLDPGGQLIWAKTLQHSADDALNFLDDFRVTENGDLIGGSTAGLWKMDSNGAITWTRTLQGNRRRWLSLLAADQGIIVSTTWSVVLAHDYDGNLLWAKKIAAGPSDEISAAAIGEDGTIHLVGSTIRMGLHLEDKIYPRAGWLVALSRDGRLLSSGTVDRRIGKLLTDVTASSQGLIIEGRDIGKSILTFEPVSKDCAAFWPIKTELSDVVVLLEPSGSLDEYEDLAVDVFDVDMHVRPSEIQFSRPCPGSISQAKE
jgi:hypothetical protein